LCILDGQPAAPFGMSRPKSIARINNVVFLSRIGQTLRWATEDVAQEDLPPDIKRLLGRLERLEARDAKRGEGDPDKGAEN
jgi:hypothetical protein